MAVSFKPIVSIVIPVYNGANFLREAIDSAINQDYGNVEILVVDDGSDDGGETGEIATSYGDKVRYFWKENGGVATALNLGIEKMKGDFFSWLSHDDVYYPSKISAQINFLERHNLANVVLFSDFDLINEDSQFMKTVQVPRNKGEDIRYLLLVDSPVHGCTTLIPKRCFEDVGGFNERLKTTQDYEMWFRLASKYPFFHVEEVLIHSRVHPGQGSHQFVLRKKEENELYSYMLENISKSVIANAGKASSVVHNYIGLYRGLRNKGCYDVAKAGLLIGLKECWYQKKILCMLNLLTFYYIIDHILIPAYRRLPFLKSPWRLVKKLLTFR